jgi:hypothetical protein
MIRLNQSKRIRWAWHVAGMSDKEMHRGRRQLGRPGSRWDSNISGSQRNMMRACTGLKWLEMGTIN